ncbi:hypothetical protein CDD81_1687 [Ophiocordyceps australis]|uniref:G-patch domain-containing protein n=1 Tax=Ophiocordyceps australis TaxID=1399860 RepID=A0A2C5X7Y6_9HYPO|nr:hypothetical protein CDD81_1687 [Ophiocordyceps australis]
MAGTRDNADDQDYMNMSFADSDAKPETSLQRTRRLKLEALERGMVKSKAQHEQEVEAARKKGLATSLLHGPGAQQSKGLAMMAKMGFTGGGLGKTADGTATREPITISIKDGRGGIGLDSDKKRQQVDDAAHQDSLRAKRARCDAHDYRQRIGREQQEARRQAQFQAAQRLAQRLDQDGGNPPEQPVPLLYRRLVRQDHEAQDYATHYPTDSFHDDVELDHDAELDAFDALSPSDRLSKALQYLRSKHYYCFWCKMAYPTHHLTGCPGVTEEHHD